MIVEVEKNIQQEIDRLTNAAFGIFDLKNPQPGIDLLIEAYTKIPTPRTQYKESFNLLKYISTAYFRAELIAESKKWISEFLESDFNIMRYGESEYLAGKIALKQNDKETAIQYFIIANQKSEGRVFKNKEDKEYFNFFKSHAPTQVRPTSFDQMLEVSLQQIENKNYVYALSLLYDCLNMQLDNPLVHIKKGICHFELAAMSKAADSFMRAYMLEGEQIFRNEETKYLDFLKTKIEIN